MVDMDERKQFRAAAVALAAVALCASGLAVANPMSSGAATGDGDDGSKTEQRDGCRGKQHPGKRPSERHGTGAVGNGEQKDRTDVRERHGKSKSGDGKAGESEGRDAKSSSGGSARDTAGESSAGGSGADSSADAGQSGRGRGSGGKKGRDGGGAADADGGGGTGPSRAATA